MANKWKEIESLIKRTTDPEELNMMERACQKLLMQVWVAKGEAFDLTKV